MSFVRLFVALPMPEECRELLAEFERGPGRKPVSRISWTRPENWHLTLKFLGDVPEKDVDVVKETLAETPFAPFEFQPQGGGFFPNAKKPRIVWVGLGRGADECAALAAHVDSAMAGLGFEPEKRPFRAHLTVGRIRQDKGDDWPGLARNLDKIAWPACLAQGFTLYKSDLTPKGPIHTALAEFTAKA